MNYPHPLRETLSAWLFCLFCLAGTSSTLAANDIELLVIEQDFCPYCERFNREIALTYPKTSEGQRAPLRKLDLFEPWPSEYVNVTPANFTPTFILVHNGLEIDRITGYPGDEYFWFLIGEMLDKL